MFNKEELTNKLSKTENKNKYSLIDSLFSQGQNQTTVDIYFERPNNSELIHALLTLTKSSAYNVSDCLYFLEEEDKTYCVYYSGKIPRKIDAQPQSLISLDPLGF